MNTPSKLTCVVAEVECGKHPHLILCSRERTVAPENLHSETQGNVFKFSTNNLSYMRYSFFKLAYLRIGLDLVWKPCV